MLFALLLHLKALSIAGRSTWRCPLSALLPSESCAAGLNLVISPILKPVRLQGGVLSINQNWFSLQFNSKTKSEHAGAAAASIHKSKDTQWAFWL
jgi:hypothetical protein